MDINAHITREDYRRWAQAQPRGRFERVNGRVVSMPAERLLHIRLKGAVWRALDDAVRAAGLAAEALCDGATVEVGADTDYQPDAVVTYGQDFGEDDVATPRPVIVAEVLSPGTQAFDLRDKLAGYFRVPSITHYLVVSVKRRQVLHHRRIEDTIVSVVVTSGPIVLDPPGITIAMDDIYRDAAKR